MPVAAVVRMLVVAVVVPLALVQAAVRILKRMVVLVY
jgi:hypothetical protein